MKKKLCWGGQLAQNTKEVDRQMGRSLVVVGWGLLLLCVLGVCFSLRAPVGESDRWFAAGFMVVLCFFGAGPFICFGHQMSKG